MTEPTASAERDAGRSDEFREFWAAWDAERDSSPFPCCGGLGEHDEECIWPNPPLPRRARAEAPLPVGAWLRERYLSFRLHHAERQTCASPEEFADLFVEWCSATLPIPPTDGDESLG